MPKAPPPVSFEFPILGLDLSKPLSQQAAGTTPDCLNVVPFEPATGRGRGGQRPGLSLLAPFPAGPITLMMECDSIETTTDFVSGFTVTGSTIENTLTYPAVGTLTAFNSQEAGTPWLATGDTSNLGNAVYREGTSASDSSTFASAACIVENQNTGSPQGLFLGFSGYSGTINAKYVSMKRQGLTAPHFSPTYPGGYAVSATFNLNDAFNVPSVYLLAVAEGTGGVATGGLAAGVCIRNDQQHLDFVTLTGQANPVVVQSSDLVAQFNTLFPTAAGGPISAPITGNIGLVLYKQSAIAGSDYYIARVTLTVSGTPYTWYVGPGSDPSQTYAMVGAAWGGNNDSFSIAGDWNVAGGIGTVWVFFNGAFNATPTWGVGPGYARLVRQLTVAGGSVYFGSAAFQSPVNSGGGIFTSGQLITGCWGQGNGYLVDGTNTWKYTTSTNTIAAFAAAAGKGTLPAGCKIAVIWRDRLILANQAGGNEQNVFASRQGDYTDWLVAQPDAQSAWALNATGTAGHVGQPIMCFAPVNDDVALVGTTGEVYIMDGDPGAGGVLTLLSNEIGVLGQEAWDVDPKGILYFVGTGGFYRWHPAMRGYFGEKALDNLSQARVAPVFQSIDRTKVNAFVRWDRDRHGCWIFLLPRDGSQGTHYWWDERTEGFFKVQFPASMSPTFVQYLDGDTPDSRYIMLGGLDGNVRYIDYTALSDQGTAIDSHVYVGPKPLAAAFGQSIITAMEFWLGAEPAGAVNLSWQMRTGDDAITAYSGAASQSGTFTSGGRQSKQLGRSRGCYATLYLSNAVLDKGWTFEQVSVLVAPGGQNR